MEETNMVLKDCCIYGEQNERDTAVTENKKMEIFKGK